MAEYIERKELLARLTKMEGYNVSPMYRRGYDDCIAVVQNAPTADVAPVRRGQWMQGLPRYTVTYCQYGDARMKPTDIWTNHPDPQFKPPCRNGAPCHIRAPRGAKTGTQGLRGSVERSVIPAALCEYIVDICEKEDLHEHTG